MTEYRKYNLLVLNGRGVTASNLIQEEEMSVSDDDYLFSFLKDWFSDREMIELHTSGSTGPPAGVSVYKDAMIESARKTIRFFGLQPGMTALLALPVSFIAGKMMVVRALVGGLNLIAVSPSVNPIKDILLPLDFAAFTPMQMASILEKSPDKAPLLGRVIIGGAPVSDRLDTLLELQPFEAWETYGMTETLSHVALRKINGENRQSGFIPIDGVTISLDERGCLIINAPGIVKGEIITNDMAEIREDGSFNVLGRWDHVINTGGVKVSPEEVEKRISHLIDRPYIISAVSHDVLGQQVVLIIEGDLFDTSSLVERLRELCSPYELPAKVCFVETFPRTDNGKIRRGAISI